MRWAYGVTTVPARHNDLLPKTLASLKAAGFDEPRLFVDGAENVVDWRRQFHGLEVTCRYPAVKTYGNWILALAELFIRNPACHRYTIFQDDFVTYKNLRGYLEKCKFPEEGYWNLYTFPSNDDMFIEANGIVQGWRQARELNSGPEYPNGKAQTSRGAVALVFDRDGVTKLLSHQAIIDRPMHASHATRGVDAAVGQAMNSSGYREWVHNPSLVQHVGAVSEMGSKPHRQATSFRGEGFDALELLKGK